MGKRIDYVTEKFKTADTLSGMYSGGGAPENVKQGYQKAYKEAMDAQSAAEKVGAGRGMVNPPLANSREQYENEREAGDPNALRLSFAEWKKL
jgi:hypothetical protein